MPENLLSGLDFNPRPPRGGRRGGGCAFRRRSVIFQSTPPARGATRMWAVFFGGMVYFNPRPPRGGRPQSLSRIRPRQNISIHAPPRGGRRARLAPCTARVAPFQSTPPARGATHGYKPSCVIFDISIHAPREGGDRGPAEGQPDRRDFNPRPPRGGRRKASLRRTTLHLFQSTPPARGATFWLTSLTSQL